MKHTWIFWALSVVLLCAMALCLSSPAMAEESASPSLPLDFSPGMPPKDAGWNSDYTEYEDSTIHVVYTKGTYKPTMNPASRSKEIETLVARIQIKDPSQLRSAMSYDSATSQDYEDAASIAARKNAILAVNGDFFKYYKNVGYVVRQGEFLRDATDGRFKYDMLIIDSVGDFHVIEAADTAAIEAFIQNDLPEGREIINTFNVGPALVVDGQVQDMSATTAAKNDLFQWNIPQQRVCIVQMGPLDYAVVETFGHFNGSQGLQLQEFAQFVDSVCPNALLAYNLDGGGSTNVIVNGVRVHRTPGLREISDVIYFASAEE